MSKLNCYGDTRVPTTGEHGYDIASGRIDDLDKMSLAYALTLSESAFVVDIGCGLGAHGIRLSNLNLEATFIDVLSIQTRLTCLKKCQPWLKMRSITKDARHLTENDLGRHFSLVYSQRFIHYLTWREALNVLELFVRCSKPGCRFYLSASGLHSELGNDYRDFDVPVEGRFSEISIANQKKHSITEPICLYTQEEFAHLCELSGLHVLKIWSSEFGNVKGVFELGV